MFNSKKVAARSGAQANELIEKARTDKEIKDDIQVMYAIRTFNQLLRQDKTTLIMYSSIKEHIPGMCQAILKNEIFQRDYKDIRIDRFLTVWPEIMHLKDEDLARVIKILEGSLSKSAIKTQ